eukprot:gene18357-52974_t
MGVNGATVGGHGRPPAPVPQTGARAGYGVTGPRSAARTEEGWGGRWGW